MQLNAVAAQIVLAAALGAQLTLRSRFLRGSLSAASLFRFLRLLFFLSAALIFGLAVFLAVFQYQIWQQNDLTKFLLPPHRDIGYFFSYAGTRFFAAWLIALLAAVVIPRIAERLNKKYGERFFYEEEFELMRLGIFLTGYPGFLFYLALVLVAALSSSLLHLLRRKGRAPTRWLWMPIALATVVLVSQFFPGEFIGQFIR